MVELKRELALVKRARRGVEDVVHQRAPHPRRQATRPRCRRTHHISGGEVAAQRVRLVVLAHVQRLGHVLPRMAEEHALDDDQPAKVRAVS